MGYERASIAAMSGYVPGKQPASATTVKLNTNENPYPPSPKVMAALGTVLPDSLRRYPEPMAEAFRDAAAKAHGTTRDHIVAVNGGDELLRLAFTTFVEPGQPVGVLEPSYSLYPVLAEIHGSPVERVPSNLDWSVPEHFAAHMNQAGVKLTFLVNPHAPSGQLLTVQQVCGIAKALNGVLLVDEAYVDFVDPALQHDMVPQLDAHPNVLLLRTLSKGYCLAGLRFGYGMGHPSLIAPLLHKTRDSYNVDVIAQRLATAAMEDRAYAMGTWASVRSERARLHDALTRLGFDAPASQSNFLLARVPPHGPTAKALLDALETHGLLVRYFSDERLRSSLRITVGTPEQNNRLLEAITEILA
jgi:histidinol-phosphate aminotransferase